MPATAAATPKHQRKDPASCLEELTAASTPADIVQGDENRTIRLHITPLTPALLKVYLGPSVLPQAQNVSYHIVETFPEKGYGYVELPAMEAQKLRKKLNGSTLKGSKVKIEEAKPEKRKALAVEDAEVDEKAAKRARKERKRKEQGVLEGVELPEGRKVKRGWTEPKKSGKDRKEKKDKVKSDKKEQKESKYTKEPELLFNAKLTPVAATEAASKDGARMKKDKKKKKAKSDEVVVHEFEKSSLTPSFLKATKVATETKPAVEYVNGKGWVDEDGNVVEPETGKARNRRVLELVDNSSLKAAAEKNPTRTPEVEVGSSPKAKSKSPKKSKKQATPPTPSSDSDAESSVVSSSSEDPSSDSGVDSEAESDAESSASSPALAPEAPQISLTRSSPAETKEVHPLEALYKRPKLPEGAISTPAKLAPINTSFSFFGDDAMDADVESGASPTNNPPLTPFTQRDLEWRGNRSAAPTPDTAAIGRRFSFPWRNGSQEVDEESGGEDTEAGLQLTNNTKANSTRLLGLAEEAEDEDMEAEEAEDANTTPIGKGRVVEKVEDDGEEEKEESEFAKWYWENRGDNNRSFKKRRRDTMKAKRLRDNRRAIGGRRV